MPKALIILWSSAFFVVLPLAFSTATLEPANPLRHALLASGVTILGFAMLIARVAGLIDLHTDRLKNPAFVCWAIFVIFGIVSITVSGNRFEAWIASLDLLVAAGFAVMTIVLTASCPDALRSAIRHIGLTALGLSIIGVIETFRGSLFFPPTVPADFRTLPHATFAYSHQLAIYLFLSAPFLLIGLKSDSPGWRRLDAVTLTVMLYVLLAATTRSVWVAIVIGGAVAALALGRPGLSNGKVASRRLFRRIGIIALAMVGVGAIAFILNPIDIRTGDSDRLMLWGKTLRMIFDHPLSGVGLGNWKIAFPLYIGPDDFAVLQRGELQYLRPSNDFLWNFAETGLLGFLAYSAIFGLLIVQSIKIARNPSNSSQRWRAGATIFGIVGYAVIAAVDYPREQPTHWVLFGLLAAVAAGLKKDPRGVASGGSNRWITSLLILITAVGAMGATAAWSRVDSQIHIRRALAARAGGDWSKVIEEIEKAYSPIFTIDPIGTPLALHSGDARYNLGDIDGALKDFERASKDHPNNFHVLNNIASCYEMKGNLQEAVTYYERAATCTPEQDEIFLNLAAAYYNAGYDSLALVSALRCDPKTLNPRYKEYLELLRSLRENSNLSRRDSADVR